MQKDITNAIIGGFADSESFIGKFLLRFALKNKQKYIVPEPETATGIPEADPQGLLEEEESTITKLQKQILEKSRDLYDDILRAQQDHHTEMLRNEEDYWIDVKRLKEDYEHDLEVMETEDNNKIAEKQAEARNKELEAQLKFQEDMRQLREKYLFDLEDALAQRDARQVIRLQKQYKMEVTNRTNEYELEKQMRARDLEKQLADIRNESEQRLAELKYEYETRNARMREDFLLEQQRMEYDHIQNMIRLYQDAGRVMLDLINQLNTAMMAGMSQTAAIASQIAGMAGATAGRRTVGSYGLTPNRRYAKGGIAVANQPTSAVFGEAGKELALFIPFNKLAGLASGGGGGGVGGVNGSIAIDLTLSPDLEARVVNNAMNGVAEVITRVSRG